MKIKTADLSRRQLNWAVAKAGNADIWREPDGLYLNLGGEVGPRYSPSTDWAQGGPIIEREHIELNWWGDLNGDNSWTAARAGEQPCSYRDFYVDDEPHKGPTPLIAAMRCFVASKLGDEVDVPEELVR